MWTDNNVMSNVFLSFVRRILSSWDDEQPPQACRWGLSGQNWPQRANAVIMHDCTTTNVFRGFAYIQPPVKKVLSATDLLSIFMFARAVYDCPLCQSKQVDEETLSISLCPESDEKLHYHITLQHLHTFHVNLQIWCVAGCIVQIWFESWDVSKVVRKLWQSGCRPRCLIWCHAWIWKG